MTETGEFRNERLELDRLLRSGIFNRAPNLSLVLNYVCSSYFQHRADQIKEYNIAVDALDRPAEFDPRTDAIVRVEAHRLRKRLKEYYQAEGADHAVQIEIPPGQYAPRFLIQNQAQGANGAVEQSTPPAPVEETVPTIPAASPAVATQKPKYLRKYWVALAGLLLLCTMVPVLSLSRGHSRSVLPTEPAILGTGETIRIACGLESGNYIDQSGNVWSSDGFFQGGTAIHETTDTIRGTRDQNLYTRRREGAFRYDIPLKPGVYELRLHFAETVYGPGNAAGGGESSRVFGVAINGREVLPNFDVIADREASMADIRVFKDISPAADGRLHLQFTPVSNMPILSGIEITPGMPGRMRPIRMVARDRGYTDKQGRFWEPDRYVSGGQLVARKGPVSSTSDPDLFRGERFGNITYAVPVAEGRYRIKLHFAETWFGPGKAGRGDGIGNRVFDILCNGVAIRRNFDIFKEAGGADREVTIDVPDVKPTRQGKIVISLLPVDNYACINAIEIVDESQ